GGGGLVDEHDGAGGDGEDRFGVEFLPGATGGQGVAAAEAFEHVAEVGAGPERGGRIDAVEKEDGGRARGRLGIDGLQGGVDALVEFEGALRGGLARVIVAGVGEALGDGGDGGVDVVEAVDLEV